MLHRDGLSRINVRNFDPTCSGGRHSKIDIDNICCSRGVCVLKSGNTGFNLVNERFERTVGVPGLFHVVTVVVQVQGDDVAIVGEEVGKDVTHGSVGKAGVWVADGAKVDGVEGINELFLEGSINILAFSVEAEAFSVLADSLTNHGSSGIVGDVGCGTREVGDGE